MCSAVRYFLKMASDFMKFHTSAASGLKSGQSNQIENLTAWISIFWQDQQDGQDTVRSATVPTNIGGHGGPPYISGRFDRIIIFFGIMFHRSAAAGLKSSQFNRKRNSKKANTRLPCIVRWVSIKFEFWIKLLNLSRTSFKALRAGRIMNFECRSSVFCRSWASVSNGLFYKRQSAAIPPFDIRYSIFCGSAVRCFRVRVWQCNVAIMLQ